MKKALAILAKLWKNTSFNNFLNLSLNQGINVLVALIATPLLYQRLGEEQFGLVNLSLSLTMMFGILVGYGFNVNGPKRMALLLKKPAEQSILINEVLFTRVFLTVGVTGLVLFSIELGAFSGYSGILALSLIVLLGEAFLPLFILQGLDRLSLLAISNAVTKVSYVTGLVLIVKSPEDARWVNLLLGSLTFLINFLLLIYLYYKRSFQFQWVRFQRIWTRLKDNFQFFSYGLAAYILMNGGFILLSNFVSENELGKFSVAQRVAILLRTVPALLAQSILQNATRLYHENNEAFEQYLKKAFVNGLIATFGLGVVFSIGSPWVVRVLAGEYVDYTANILSLLCFLPFLAMINIDNMIRILVAEHKDILARAMWVTTLVMLLSAFAGSYFYGGYGLAVAMLCSEAFNYVMHRYLLKKKLNQH